MEQSPQTEQTKPWNQQLKEWCASKGKTSAQIAREVGIAESTFRDYIAGRISDIKRVSRERLGVLYQATGLECFKYGGIERYEQRAVQTKPRDGSSLTEKEDGADYRTFLGALSRVESELSGIKKEIQKVSSFDIEKYEVELGAKNIIGLLEQLACSLEPFRTGSEKDRAFLVDKIRKNAETYSYVHQMITAFQQEDSSTWIRLAQPPHIVRKIFGGKEK